jgi:hypothetical protein
MTFRGYPKFEGRVLCFPGRFGWDGLGTSWCSDPEEEMV